MIVPLFCFRQCTATVHSLVARHLPTAQPHYLVYILAPSSGNPQINSLWIPPMLLGMYIVSVVSSYVTLDSPYAASASVVGPLAPRVALTEELISHWTPGRLSSVTGRP